MVTLSLPARRLGLFALLSTADFLLTRYLLTSGSEAVYESNPIAGWWLTHYGWMGLATFKIAAVLCVAMLGVVISLRRPDMGRRVLGFGCLMLAGVVLYSAYLAGQMHRHSENTGLEETALQNQERTLEREFNRSMAYRQELVRVTEDYVAHRCTLAEATLRLETSERGREPKWRQTLRLVYGLDNDDECFAASIVNTAVQTYFRSSATREDAREYLSDYRAAYGHDLMDPTCARVMVD
jgi:hypothetical protein